MKIQDITGIKQSIIPNLLPSQFGGYHLIAYLPYGHNTPAIIYNRKFAQKLRSALQDFKYSLKHGIIIGLVRKRLPNEWHESDTIERSPSDINSIHRGLIRTIEEESIPLFDPSTRTLIDIVAAALNFAASKKAAEESLKKYYPLQGLIINEIIKGNPCHQPAQAEKVKEAGEAHVFKKVVHEMKNVSRVRSIADKLDRLQVQ